jgi:Saxitoxin biosynthesis operon protein SxtJ
MTDSKTNAIHEPLTRDEEIKGSSNRAFGIVFAVVFTIVGLWPLMSGGSAYVWALIVSGLFLVLALACPSVLALPNRLWMKFGLLLHRVTNPILMGLVFFVTVTPIAILMRLRGKDPLHRKFDPDAASYWIERRPPGPAPDTMKNQF